MLEANQVKIIRKELGYTQNNLRTVWTFLSGHCENMNRI